jgi:hypothetical protein
MINLTAKNTTEQRVLDYLQANASEVLSERINAGKKTIAGALTYAKDEARKMAEGESCVVVDDATVFGWIIHYFEEDHIEEEVKTTRAPIVAGRCHTNPQIVPVPAISKEQEIAELKRRLAILNPVKVKRSKKPEPTQSMFDALLGGGK